MRLRVEYETDQDGMLCVWVYDNYDNRRIAVGNQYDDESGMDTVKRVFNEALEELDR